MLTIEIPGEELYNRKTREFITVPAQKLRLEHSLVSISKWESKWNKPFISKEPKSVDETIDYIKCMTLTQNVDEKVYLNITDEIIDEVNKYIDAPMTATWFSESKDNKRNNKIITSEVIYYWMFSFGINKECEKWHLNRLLTLIRVFGEENKPKKKRSKREIMNDHKARVAAARQRYGSGE